MAKKVDIDGLTIEISDDAQADALIQRRQADKDQRKRDAERLAQLESERRQAEEARAEAERKAEVEKAKARGDYETAIKKAREQDEQRMQALASRIRDSRIESAVRAAKGIVPTAVADIVAHVSQSCTYDPDADKVRVKADGTEQELDSFLTQYLDKRPHFRLPTGQPGTGAAGSGTTADGVKTITIAEYDAAMRQPGTAQPIARALAEGKLKIQG